MAGLLMLNTTLQNQAFQARALNRQATELAYAQADLENQLDAPARRRSWPGARRRSGCGPTRYPAFLVMPKGKVVGEPSPVTGTEAPSLVVKTPAELAADRGRRGRPEAKAEPRRPPRRRRPPAEAAGEKAAKAEEGRGRRRRPEEGQPSRRPPTRRPPAEEEGHADGGAPTDPRRRRHRGSPARAAEHRRPPRGGPRTEHARGSAPAGRRPAPQPTATVLRDGHGRPARTAPSRGPRPPAHAGWRAAAAARPRRPAGCTWCCRHGHRPVAVRRPAAAAAGLRLGLLRRPTP